MLLIIGPPVISVSYLVGRRHWVYPRPSSVRATAAAERRQGARRGREHSTRADYIFISNHRSFLETAALFYHTGRRIGILAKRNSESPNLG